MKDLATKNPTTVRRNLKYVPEFGRWDDLYAFVGTPVENDALQIMKKQLELDVQCKTPSLLAKWMKSENTSSHESRKLGNITREYLGMSHKQYRKTLSILRERINVLERLMSENKWNEIEFDKIPSKAGIKYKNAFARHDLERANAGVQTYEDFAKDETKDVNAAILNPVDIAHQIFSYISIYDGKHMTLPSETERLMWQKYWDNLTDYYNGRKENGLAIVDVSGSMRGIPMEAAVSMGAYIAERGHGPFTNHFITFSNNPQLVRFDGVDVYDKFTRAKSADWGMSTNLEAVFDMMLKVIRKNNCSSDEIPETLYIFSDMEFNEALLDYWEEDNNEYMDTLLESIAKKWVSYGYELPRVIFWNLDARQNNIPALGGRFSYISGFNMNMIEAVLSGKDGYDLMMMKLDSDRYSCIQ